MNLDDILRMARSAGMHYSGACTLTGMESHVERFANLVAAAEREAVLDTVYSYAKSLSWNEDFQADIRARGEP